MRSLVLFNKCLRLFPSLVILLLLLNDYAKADNLTCYQCVRNANVECSPKELLPCDSKWDRCVTHITNKGGYTIKRECGLGPCAFEDNMANRALGFETCDINKSNYCLSCCRENGCNKNESIISSSPNLMIILFIVIVLTILNVHGNFQPPYVGKTFDKY